MVNINGMSEKYKTLTNEVTHFADVRDSFTLKQAGAYSHILLNKTPLDLKKKHAGYK